MQGVPEGPTPSKQRKGGKRDKEVDVDQDDDWTPFTNREKQLVAANQKVFKAASRADRDSRRPEVPGRLKKKMQQKLDGWRDLGGTLVRYDDDDIVPT